MGQVSEKVERNHFTVAILIVLILCLVITLGVLVLKSLAFGVGLLGVI